MSFLCHLLLDMSICAIIYTLKQTHSYVLGLNPRLCIGFKLVWVEKIEGLVLVGLKMALNGYSSSMVLRDTCTGMVQVCLGMKPFSDLAGIYLTTMLHA